VFHGFEYAWVKDTPGIEPLVVTRPNCGKVQACLVVNTKCKAKGPDELKGACVALPKGSKAHCQMFLDWLHEKEGVPDGNCCPAKPAGAGPLTPEEVLGEVAAGRCDAGLVDVSSLLAFEKQYPGAFTGLKVLRQSELLPSAVVVYRKAGLTKDQVEAVKRGLVDATKSVEGKAFAMFWHLKGFEAVTPDYLKLVARCLETYPPPGSLSPAASRPK